MVIFIPKQGSLTGLFVSYDVSRGFGLFLHVLRTIHRTVQARSTSRPDVDAIGFTAQNWKINK